MGSKYLEELEKLNTTTKSIYELKDLEVLIILKDGTNLTQWEDVNWNDAIETEYESHPKCNDDIIYVSEDLSKYTDLSRKYAGLHSLRAIVALNVFDVDNMGRMFWECWNLQDISSLKDWDVSSATNMDGMFRECKNLQDISSLKEWDVSSARNMWSMFSDCSSLIDLSSLAKWDMSSVIDMHAMFFGCKSLVDLFALKDWNVSSVEIWRLCSKIVLPWLICQL